MSNVFSPLALTQTLPFLPLDQGKIDYQSERRTDPNLFRATLTQPGSRVMLVRDGLVALPKKRQLFGNGYAPTRLVTLPGSYLAAQLEGTGQLDNPALESAADRNMGFQEHRALSGDTSPHVGGSGAFLIFLGSYGTGRHVAESSGQLKLVDGASSVLAVDLTHCLHGGYSSPELSSEHNTEGVGSPLFQRALEGFGWTSLLDFASQASSEECGQAATAVALSMWHKSQNYCPQCGAQVRPAVGGWRQLCRGPDPHLLFPRIEPAVITAIVDRDDRLLLQHNRAWSDANRYSVCAGFVEAGENLEHACRREALEETGIRLGEIRYLGSQPWPMPGSLMVAFKAYASHTDIQVDNHETTAARWFSRKDLGEALDDGSVKLPAKASIARYMIAQWYGQDL